MADRQQVQHYEIRLRGLLSPHWSAWFDGLAVDTEPDGITVLRGSVPDQAALHGLLQRLHDVGIPLVSLTEIPATQSTQPTNDTE